MPSLMEVGYIIPSVVHSQRKQALMQAHCHLALSAFSDLVLAAYPVVHVLKLKMSLQKRLALCAALGMGAM